MFQREVCGVISIRTAEVATGFAIGVKFSFHRNCDVAACFLPPVVRSDEVPFAGARL